MTDRIIADDMGWSLLLPSRSGKSLVVAEAEGPIVIYDLAQVPSQPRLVTSFGGGQLVSIAFSNSGRTLLLARRDRIECWDMGKCRWIRSLTIPRSVTRAVIQAMAPHPQRSLVAGMVGVGGVVLWNLASGDSVYADGPASQADATWTQCGRWLISRGGGELHFWRLSQRQTLRHVGACQPDAGLSAPTCLTAAHTGPGFFVGLSDGSLQRWEVPGHVRSRTVQAHPRGFGGVDHIVHHPGRALLLSTSANEVSLWNSRGLHRMAQVRYPLVTGFGHLLLQDAVFAGDAVVVQECQTTGNSYASLWAHQRSISGSPKNEVEPHHKHCLRLVPLTSILSGWQFTSRSLTA